MKTMKAKSRVSVLMMAGLILMVATVAGIAQRNFMLASAARPEVKMSLAGGVERDSKLVALDKSSVVKQGDVLVWTIDAVNSGNAAAREYKAVAHIPRGTEYVDNSAQAEGAQALFSIDGGKSYSPQPMIEQKDADGSVKRVPAPVSMYTDIRYELANPLAEGGKFSASYKVRVK
jgi:uncharacterized repeat protein (TIGR01451 family)